MKPFFETTNGKLYKGDCIDVLNTLDDESIDLIISDPPYSSGARQTSQLRQRKGMLRNERFHEEWFGTDNLSTSGFMFFMRGIALLAFQKMKTGGHMYLFIDWRNYSALEGVLESAGWRINNLIVWDKEILGMGQDFRFQHELIIFCSKGKPSPANRHDFPNILRSKRVKQDKHPTEKPEYLIYSFVEMSSQEGDIVLDFFMGSGVTAAVCEKHRRRWIGSEISDSYCEDIKNRVVGITKQESMFGVAGYNKKMVRTSNPPHQISLC